MLALLAQRLAQHPHALRKIGVLDDHARPDPVEQRAARVQGSRFRQEHQQQIDLFLYRWNGFNWSLVAQSRRAGSSESISYSGGGGYYAFVVGSVYGNGQYTVRYEYPQP